MLEFTVTLPTYDEDEATKRVLSWIKESFPNMEGVGFYMHPVLMTTSGVTPEITIVTKTHHPVIVRCLAYQLDDLQKIESDTWCINHEEKDSPLLEGADFVVNIRSKFDKDRILRDRLKPFCVLALPSISQHDFNQKFPHSLDGQNVIWADGVVTPICKKLEQPLSEDEWRRVRSIVQGINPLTKGIGQSPKVATTLGEAIRSIDRDIALLDEDQVNAALSIAPGPQRIRGLAGTGKTVLLAMKAANIHLRYPNKKILFTFNTQSLYNQIQNMITKFYRNYSDKDPDWENLHIRHAWGGPRKPGVYYDTCTRLVVPPLRFEYARMVNMDNPFLSCCRHLLSCNLQPIYDYIMIDEAQDFAPEFFQVLYKLSCPPHNIYWVYDELQSLFAEKMPTPEELFGHDSNGKPIITLDGVAYPGGIEKDLVLHKSYRCPQDVLMLAHAIGLGMYSNEGCVQMLPSKASWEGLGYVVESGLDGDTFVKGRLVTILRPAENSPNPITTRYQGKQKIIQAEIFEKREDELNWIADSIYNDITVEKVSPENIVVICLDGRKMRRYLPPLQQRLVERGLPSSIPGLGDESTAFAEPGRVTLSTVFRAKGNESYIIYIFSFEALYDYEEALQNRNRAFTAITRSKAWVRISGIGKGMATAKDEIDRILADQPRFRFVFPDMAAIRSLDAETSRRKQALWKARENISGIVDLDPKAIEALAAKEPRLFKKLLTLLEEANKRENK